MKWILTIKTNINGTYESCKPKKSNLGKHREVSISLIQVYLDEAFDLLNPGKVGLSIREDPVRIV